MKSALTIEIENCALKEFSKMGSFICPEVGINIERYGYPNWYRNKFNVTDEQLESMGYKKSLHKDTEIVDILLWESNSKIWRCFEIKISLSDFKSSSAKTFVGNYNYYLIPDTLLNKVENLVPKNIGIYVYKTIEPKYKYESRIYCYKRAKKQELQCTSDEIYYAMIKSLYREMNKFKKC